MNTAKRFLLLAFSLLLVPTSPALALQTPTEQSSLVGHITHIEGDLLRYTPDGDEWVGTVKDAPCGIDEMLYANTDSRAELIMPNRTWVRLGNETHLSITEIGNDLTEIDIESGTVRLYNKSSVATITASTPFGKIKAPPQTTCDLYLEDDSIVITTLKGSIDFLHVANNTHYGITAGTQSIKADFNQATTSEELLDDSWHSWNAERDGLWDERFAEQEDSPSYLPDNLQYESYVLEENGTWENVYYEGSYRYFWRPRCVAYGWSPFTVGRWTIWYGDHCWIPCEPFGYITHHYGNWVYLDGCRQWYWAPPVCGRKSFYSIGSSWYPGRVAWIYRGSYIGWTPLAPFEPYYSCRYWGPRSSVVVKGRKHISHYDKKQCRYKNHSVIVRKDNFYKVSNYKKVRLQKMRDTVIDNYHRTSHINSKVLRNLKENRQRFNFSNRKVKHKPNLTTAKFLRQKKGRKGFSLKNDKASTRNPFVNNTPRKLTAMRKQRLSPRITTTERSNKGRQLTLKRKTINRPSKSLEKHLMRGITRRNLKEIKKPRIIEGRSKIAGFKSRQPRLSSSLKTVKKRGAPRLKLQKPSRTKQLNPQRSIGFSRIRGGLR
jgi:hypothetical protein